MSRDNSASGDNGGSNNGVGSGLGVDGESLFGDSFFSNYLANLNRNGSTTNKVKHAIDFVQGLSYGIIALAGLAAIIAGVAGFLACRRSANGLNRENHGSTSSNSVSHISNNVSLDGVTGEEGEELALAQRPSARPPPGYVRPGAPAVPAAASEDGNLELFEMARRGDL